MKKGLIVFISVCCVTLLCCFASGCSGTAREQTGSDMRSGAPLPAVYACDIKDGVYEIEAGSDSAFFRIKNATLYVDGDEMTARFVIPSKSYLRVYPGTGAEALIADESEWIEAETEGGYTVFTIPVEALNRKTECCAYSKKRKRWYDRRLTFYSSSLPEGAVAETLTVFPETEAEQSIGFSPESLDITSSIPAEPVVINLDDGEYSIEAAMTGGSGRASVSSPTYLTVRDGRAYARLIWSSPYYDYMIVGGVTYYNETSEGGLSEFEIPIPMLDRPFPVIADTTAMGEPVAIRYELTFYADSVGPKSHVPQEAAKQVLALAAVIIVGGGALHLIIQKKKEK